MEIKIVNAREHNLKNIDLILNHWLTAITGVSGSGKSSLLFDTVYHEAHRRFLDIYSVGSSAIRLSPAQVDTVSGIGPALAVAQNLLNRNPASTLASSTGIHAFLRILFARFGSRFCPECSQPMEILTSDELEQTLRDAWRNDGAIAFIPLVRNSPGSHRTLIHALTDEFGHDHLQIDGITDWDLPLDPTKTHDIFLNCNTFFQDTTPPSIRRIIQLAHSWSSGGVVLSSQHANRYLSLLPACSNCGRWFEELHPGMFNMRCLNCQGSGCSICHETGLNPDAGAVRWDGWSFPEIQAETVSGLLDHFRLKIGDGPGKRLLSEILNRLETLNDVGLGYLSLNRSSPSLSRGESQRVRIAVALTSRLEGLVYVLDEPTIGQHPADVSRLVPVLRRLKGPVLFIEHDQQAVVCADEVIDVGPGAGDHGGQVVFQGSPAELLESNTITGRLFSDPEPAHIPAAKNPPREFIVVNGAKKHNLKKINIQLPLQRLTVITGVSGSGKSSFVRGVLVPSLEEKKPVYCSSICSPPLKPVFVNQNPIGKNPRSNPATYTKLAEVLRDGFAAVTGHPGSVFSFNRKEGACPICAGIGALEVRMRYLPSVWIRCGACEGRRYSGDVLEATAMLGNRRCSIADVLEMTVDEAHELLVVQEGLPATFRKKADRILQSLMDTGLGYLPLGQPSPWLSGGEAQRVKLAKYLSLQSLSRQLLILDEPSTGLHPKDIAALLKVLHRLVQRGCTMVVVEHSSSIIRSADWVVDLGPGAGPAGGNLMYQGPLTGLLNCHGSATGQALCSEKKWTVHQNPAPILTSPEFIHIQQAAAHNLKNVDVAFPLNKLTVVTGISGAGKSSLVRDVLEVEARRRFLETLSMYERQGVREGTEAAVESISGLGVVLTAGGKRGRFDRRSTVGTESEVCHHLAILLAAAGKRTCLMCGGEMIRKSLWECSQCKETASVAGPQHFSSSTYSAACKTCNGVGSLQKPKPEKLIIHPEKPLCAGAMYSPGFFPKGFLCKPFNSGYYMVQAIAAKYGFDTHETPWNDIPPDGQHAFLFGDGHPLTVTFESRSKPPSTSNVVYPGFYGFIRDWDIGGTYTVSEPCPECEGTKLRKKYNAVTLCGMNMHQLCQITLKELHERLAGWPIPSGLSRSVKGEVTAVLSRLNYLKSVGLGYLHLDRIFQTLSAGEAQRIKLSGLMGSGLTGLTILLDEPSRGLHPSEVSALLNVLKEFRNEGNTVIVVEHDEVIINGADWIIDMGPGPGEDGGKVVAAGPPEIISESSSITGTWLSGNRDIDLSFTRRAIRNAVTIRGASENNLRIPKLDIPLNMMTGICGVSGSGKSTLIMDTIGRVLAPQKQTTSVAYEPIAPGKHDSISGQPARTVMVDQTRAGVHNPLHYLGLHRLIMQAYAESEDAAAAGLTIEDLTQGCTHCNGKGLIRLDMQFLPDEILECQYCHGTGLNREAERVRLRNVCLPDLLTMSVDVTADLLKDYPGITRKLKCLQDAGLGYLKLQQPARKLSGGELQRLKIARELSRKVRPGTLYILDEPTVGQHLEDVYRLAQVLRNLVNCGHSVWILEHHSLLLAACDWLIELGPEGGPSGGRVVAQGTPESIAQSVTSTAKFIRRELQRGTAN